MKQTIVLHGMPDREEYFDPNVPAQSNRHWFPWLKKQIALRDELCQIPELPHPYNPVYADYLKIFEQFLIKETSVLIGHSCGAGFLVRYLSENSKSDFEKIILIAPWLDPAGELGNDNDFFKFEIDPSISERTEIHVFISSDDDQSILDSVKIIKEKIPNATYHEFTDREHFCQKEFPELLELLK